MTQFSDLRIVATLPPKNWFGGHDFDLAIAAIEVLRERGVGIETVSALEWDDPVSRAQAITRLKRFEAHLAIGTPNAGYGLYFVDEGFDHGEAANLFTDILSVPLVLVWDHLLTQAPNFYLSHRLGESPPRPGALEQLQRKLTHPRSRHYSPDSAHIEIYEALGLLSKGASHRYTSGAHRHFLDAGRVAASPSARGRVGFAGNVYGSNLEILQLPLIRALDEALISAKCKNWGEAGWNLFCEALEQVPEDALHGAGLTPDYPFFWKVALDLIGNRVATAFRLDVLESIEQPIDFYGNFADPAASEHFVRSDHIQYCGSANFFTELPEVFRSREIWVDATNAPFIRGCGAKVLFCFAAGGFMLMDYRADLRAELGSLADRFMFSSADELREKVAYYFAHSKERIEIVAEMQGIIRERFTWDKFYAGICSDFLSAPEAD